MKTHKEQMKSMLLAWLIGMALGVAAALSQGCRTHYQIKAAYEREARMNVMRGKPAMCTVAGEQKYVGEVGFWEMVLDNWPEYAKEGGVYVIAAAALYYYVENKKNSGESAGDTFNTYNTYETPATESAP